MSDYNINLNRLAWARQCAGGVDSRLYLDGVRIEPREAGGVWLVATDGHVLAIAKDEQGVALEPITIQLDKTLAEACGPNTEYDECTGEPIKSWPLLDDHRLCFDAMAPQECSVARIHWKAEACVTGLVWRVYEPPKKAYPDWRRVLRARSDRADVFPGPVGSFNPDKLAQLAYKGGGVTVMPRSGFRTLVRGGPDEKASPSALVLVDDAPWALGAIMPRAVRAVEQHGETMRELVDPADLPPGLDEFQGAEVKALQRSRERRLSSARAGT